MSNGMGGYAIPADLTKEAANLTASRYHLTVPETAVRKNGVARWNESVQIKSASRDVVTSRAKDTHTVFTVNTTVLAGSGSPNEGRAYVFSLRINYDSLTRDADDGQRKMSMGAISRLIQIAEAGMPDSFESGVGLTEEIIDAMFPVIGGSGDDTYDAEHSVLEGRMLVLTVKDDDNPKRRFADRNAQDIVAILPYTEE